MKCPKCKSTLVSYRKPSEPNWGWGLKWMSIKAFATIAGEEYYWMSYKLHNIYKIVEPRQRFMRLRYFCRCTLCNFEWDIITAGDLNELS